MFRASNATLYTHGFLKSCSVCLEPCKCGHILACISCSRIFHRECWNKRESEPFDCRCENTITILNGVISKCIVPKCKQKADCIQSLNWTCTSCYDNLKTTFESWLMKCRLTQCKKSSVVLLFLKNIKSPFQNMTTNTENIVNKAVIRCMNTIIVDSVYCLTITKRKRNFVVHIFSELLSEMAVSGDVYSIPFCTSAFSSLKPLSELQGQHVLAKFKTHIRSLAAPISSKPSIQFLPCQKVRAISDHQITTKETIITRLVESGKNGIGRDILFSEYKNAIFDLDELEKNNDIFFSDDRKTAYIKSAYTPVIPGLLELWQEQVLLNQIKIIPKK